MKYFAIIDDKQVGPLTLEEMPAAGVTPDTYVWSKEMVDWKQAREVGDICRFFRNRLFDLAHPALARTQPQTVNANENEPEEDQFEDVPLRFRRQIEKADPEEVDLGSFSQQTDFSQEPSTWWPFPMLLSLIICFPIGLIAVSNARKSRKAWKAGQAEQAHEYARRGKMAAGMSFSFGMIIMALLLSLAF